MIEIPFQRVPPFHVGTTDSSAGFGGDAPLSGKQANSSVGFGGKAKASVGFGIDAALARQRARKDVGSSSNAAVGESSSVATGIDAAVEERVGKYYHFHIAIDLSRDVVIGTLKAMSEFIENEGFFVDNRMMKDRGANHRYLRYASEKKPFDCLDSEPLVSYEPHELHEICRVVRHSGAKFGHTFGITPYFRLYHLDF